MPMLLCALDHGYDRVASTGMNFATWDAKGAGTLNDGDVSVVASRACIPSDHLDHYPSVDLGGVSFSQRWDT